MAHPFQVNNGTLCSRTGSDLRDYIFISFIFQLVSTIDPWWWNVAPRQKVTLLPWPSDTSKTVTFFSPPPGCNENS